MMGLKVFHIWSQSSRLSGKKSKSSSSGQPSTSSSARPSSLDSELEELRRFADEHPDVVERDRARAKRHSQRRREAAAKRMEEWVRNRKKLRKDALREAPG